MSHPVRMLKSAMKEDEIAQEQTRQQQFRGPALLTKLLVRSSSCSTVSNKRSSSGAAVLRRHEISAFKSALFGLVTELLEVHSGPYAKHPTNMTLY